MTAPVHEGPRRPAVPPGAALRTRLALTAPALRASSARLWSAPGLGVRYAVYLRAMHGVVRASVPLMERAAARCAELGAHDSVAGPVARYLREHTEEERGHDDWLLADLAALGDSPERTVAEQPSPTVARLAGAQYYWIEHHHPVALLGYIAVLEGNAPAPWLADRIAGTAGVPRNALRTVRDHAALDTGHITALYALLDGLPLSPALTNAVAMSALHTVEGLMELYARIHRASRPDHHAQEDGTHDR